MNRTISRSITAPRTSEWGRIQTRKKLTEGVYLVSTASHGGIMVSTLVADKHISKKAKEIIGQPERGWWHFEEDCDWAIFAAENRDIVPEHCLKHIDTTLRRWHPEYLGIEDPEKTKTPATEQKKTHEEHIRECAKAISEGRNNTEGWQPDMTAEDFWQLKAPAGIREKDRDIMGIHFVSAVIKSDTVAVFMADYVADENHAVTFFLIGNTVTANVIPTDRIRDLIAVNRWEKRENNQ